jgi:hypothetical protein
VLYGFKSTFTHIISLNPYDHPLGQIKSPLYFGEFTWYVHGHSISGRTGGQTTYLLLSSKQHMSCPRTVSFQPWTYIESFVTQLLHQSNKICIFRVDPICICISEKSFKIEGDSNVQVEGRNHCFGRRHLGTARGRAFLFSPKSKNICLRG